MPKEDGQFKPGNKFGKGRPKKENAWTEILNKILDSKEIKVELLKGGAVEKVELTAKNTMRYALGIALLQAGLEGNIQAIKELCDRTVGKPPQGIDITTDDEPITRTPLTKEQELLISEALKNADKSK